MDPINLQKQLRDNSKDLEDCLKDLKQWAMETKKKDQDLRTRKEENIEQDKLKTSLQDNKRKKETLGKSEGTKLKKKNLPKDYSYWEKIDYDAEIEKIDREKEDSDLTDEYDESVIEEANDKKDKGNSNFKLGNYEEAIKNYTNAIGCYPYDPVYYSNRAMCYLKLNKYKNAESDCTKAIQIDHTCVKAFYRRALARKALNQFSEAKDDVLKILRVESSNKEAKMLLEKLNFKLKERNDINDEPQLPKSKFAQSRQQTSTSSLHNFYSQPSTSKPPSNIFSSLPFLDKIIERFPDSSGDRNIRTMPKSSSFIEELKPLPAQSSTQDTPAINITEKGTKGEGVKNKIKWPCGSNVELFKNINKQPKDVSKQRLKRVRIFDVDSKTNLVQNNIPAVTIIDSKISTELDLDKNEPKDVKLTENSFKKGESQAICENFDDLDYSVDISQEDFSLLNLPIPTTSVSFYTNWKLLHNDEEKRFLYLRQINPTAYTSIFKNSLDTRVFGEIIECLTTQFILKNINVFNYLYGLTKVKRFSTLVMFKSKKDTEGLLKLIDFMRTDTSRSKADINNLIKKFEM